MYEFLLAAAVEAEREALQRHAHGLTVIVTGAGPAAAAAEAMEGFGVATAAAMAELPFVEIRAISNAVGPRDREAWRIDAALEALSTVGQTLAALQAPGVG